MNYHVDKMIIVDLLVTLIEVIRLSHFFHKEAHAYMHSHLAFYFSLLSFSNPSVSQNFTSFVQKHVDTKTLASLLVHAGYICCGSRYDFVE